MVVTDRRKAQAQKGFHIGTQGALRRRDGVLALRGDARREILGVA